MIRTSFIVLAVAAVIGSGVYYAFTSLSYGPLEEHAGQVTRAEYVPAHEQDTFRKDEHGRPLTRHVDASWRVTITWDEGTYESHSESLFNQVKLGQDVTLHVRQRVWRNKPFGWSVQTVTVR